MRDMAKYREILSYSCIIILQYISHTSLMASIMMGAMMGTLILDRTRRALARMSWFGSLSPFWKVLMDRRARSCCSSA